MVVSALAYASGLFLGIAIYRGEIGPRRRAGASTAASVRSAARHPETPSELTERRRSSDGRRKLGRLWYRLEHRARGLISIILMVGALLAVAIAVYTVLISLPARPIR